MEKLYDKILDTVVFMVTRPWSAILKLFTIVSMIIIIITAYQVQFNGLKIYNPTKRVIVAQSQIDRVDKVIEGIVHSHKCIQAISVYVYQPAALPKKQAELVTVHLNQHYTNAGLHDFLKYSYLTPINTMIYRTLSRVEVMDIDGTSGTKLDYIVDYDNQINYARIYGLYQFGAVYGSVVVLFKRHEESNLNDPTYNNLSTELYNDIRYINTIMFEVD